MRVSLWDAKHADEWVALVASERGQRPDQLTDRSQLRAEWERHRDVRGYWSERERRNEAGEWYPEQHRYVATLLEAATRTEGARAAADQHYGPPA